MAEVDIVNSRVTTAQTELQKRAERLNKLLKKDPGQTHVCGL